MVIKMTAHIQITENFLAKLRDGILIVDGFLYFLNHPKLKEPLHLVKLNNLFLKSRSYFQVNREVSKCHIRLRLQTRFLTILQLRQKFLCLLIEPRLSEY